MKDPTQILSVPASALLEFTQSEFACWDTCAFKWYLKYAWQLDKVNEFSMSLMFGDAMHRTIAEWTTTKKPIVQEIVFPEGGVVTLEDEKKREYMQIVLNGTMQAYFEWYKDDLKAFKKGEDTVEQLVEVEIAHRGHVIKLKGILDRFTNLKTTQQIVDHKSCGLLNEAVKSAWQFKFQFLFYAWLAHNSSSFRQRVPAEFMVNGVKKTQLKQKQDETLPAFENRIYRDILTRPGEYFWREVMKFDATTMDRFEKELLLPKLDRIIELHYSLAEKHGSKEMMFLALNKNDQACWNWNRPCEFLPICTGTFAENMEQYRQRKQKHTNYRDQSLD